MSCYLDTSALVPLLVTEPRTLDVMTWLRRQQPGTLFISDWTHTEISSALALKLRTGELTLDLRAAALAAWSRLHTASLPTLAVLPEHFEAASRFADRYELGLRGGDALHLAVAAAGGHTLVTLDTRMAEAAPQLGIPVEHCPG